MRTSKGMREHVQIRDRFESDTKHVENISGQPKIQETLHFIFNISKQKVDKRNFILEI